MKRAQKQSKCRQWTATTVVSQRNARRKMQNAASLLSASNDSTKQQQQQHGKSLTVAVQDEANRRWTEIENDLRRSDYGLQVQAILCFPEFLDNYCFPVYVNSTFLKLANMFRTGSNFIKWHILDVFEQSRRHWVMVRDIADIIKMLVSVTYSNDPAARTMTLKVFGTMDEVASDVDSIIHFLMSVMNSDAAEPYEQAASITVCRLYGTRSSTFSSKLYHEVLRKKLDCPVLTKDNLPVLRCIGYLRLEPDLAFRVLDFMQRFFLTQSEALKGHCLKTMTVCCLRNYVIVPHTIQFLLEQFGIRGASTQDVTITRWLLLRCLQVIASNLSTVWSRADVIALMRTLRDQIEHEQLVVVGLVVARRAMSRIEKSAPTTSYCRKLAVKVAMDLNDEIWRIVNVFMFSPNRRICARACLLALDIVCNVAEDVAKKKKKKGIEERECKETEASLSHEDTKAGLLVIRTAVCSVLLGAWDDKEASDDLFKMCLRVIYNYLLLHYDILNNIDTIVTLRVCQMIDTVPYRFTRFVVTWLLAIARTNPRCISAAVLAATESYLQASPLSFEHNVNLCMVFELCGGSTSVYQSEFEAICRRVDYWTLYKLAQKAAEMSAFRCAAMSLDRLVHLDVSVESRLYLSFLQHLCMAEAHLGSDQTCSADGPDVTSFGASASVLEYRNAEATVELLSMIDSQYNWHHYFLKYRMGILRLFHSLNIVLGDLKHVAALRSVRNQLNLLSFSRRLNSVSKLSVPIKQGMLDSDQNSILTVNRMIEHVSTLEMMLSNFLLVDNQVDKSDLLSAVGGDLLNQLIDDESVDLTNFQHRVDIIRAMMERTILRPMDRLPLFLLRRFQRTKLQIISTPCLKSSADPIQMIDSQSVIMSLEGFFSYEYPSNQRRNKDSKVMNQVKHINMRTYARPLSDHGNSSIDQNNHGRPLFELKVPVDNENHFSWTLLFNMTKSHCSGGNHQNSQLFAPHSLDKKSGLPFGLSSALTNDFKIKRFPTRQPNVPRILSLDADIRNSTPFELNTQIDYIDQANRVWPSVSQIVTHISVIARQPTHHGSLGIL